MKRAWVLMTLAAGLAGVGCGQTKSTGAGIDASNTGPPDATAEVHAVADGHHGNGTQDVTGDAQDGTGSGPFDGRATPDSRMTDTHPTVDADAGQPVHIPTDTEALDSDDATFTDEGSLGEVFEPPDTVGEPDEGSDTVESPDAAGDLTTGPDTDTAMSADSDVGADTGSDALGMDGGGLGDGDDGESPGDGDDGGSPGDGDSGGESGPSTDVAAADSGADAAGDAGSDTPPVAPRVVLTYDELMNGPEQASPVDDMAGFSMPDNAPLADHVFEGRLALLDQETVGNFLKVKDDYNYDLDPERLHLPDFDHAFVQEGHDLIPAQRGNINTSHPFWTLILSPGKVWKEEGDNGWSRASLPFAIVQRNSNCTHNGLLTFLFDDTSVSRVHYQITQETCAYFQGDFWGLLTANYLPGDVTDAAQIRAAFGEEKAKAYPTKPISDLAVDYPGFDLDTLTSGVTPIHMTRYGFVYDGVSYVSPCVTRSGLYPYCDVMRMPSYSLAKSVFAGTARMLLEQWYGADVGMAFVSSLLPEASTGQGDWTDVTIDHCLDMTTGHYKFATYMIDEGGATMSNGFFLAQSLADKTAGAFDWKRKVAPGLNWVYRTSDTFVATRAMSEYLKALEGTDADLFEQLVQEVWEPLGVGPGAHTSLRTSDNNWQGETFGGYGLWLIADDLAKITDLLNVHSGQIGGTQVLSLNALNAAMQRDPTDRGMLTTAATPFMYNNGFWALEFTPEQGYACNFWVPFMSGYGGITVAMMPNGATYWYVSDNSEYDWQDVVAAAHASIADCCSP